MPTCQHTRRSLAAVVVEYVSNHASSCLIVRLIQTPRYFQQRPYVAATNTMHSRSDFDTRHSIHETYTGYQYCTRNGGTYSAPVNTTEETCTRREYEQLHTITDITSRCDNTSTEKRSTPRLSIGRRIPRRIQSPPYRQY